MTDPNKSQPDQATDDADKYGHRFSGYVIILLVPNASPTASPKVEPDLVHLARREHLSGLTELLEVLHDPPSRPLITGIDHEVLMRMERRAADGGDLEAGSLTRFWRVDVREAPRPLHQVVDWFARLPEVEMAYPELIADDPRVNAQNNPRSPEQGYLDPAPSGIDARWAWTRMGGAGEDVGICDVEMQWLLTHQDIVTQNPQLIVKENRAGRPGYTGAHGTAVLGILSAADNNLGGVGIVPSVRVLQAASHFDGRESLHVANAIITSLPAMSPGDIFLLEVQRDGLPTEVDHADRRAMRIAHAHGVIVVEAAANGSLDLDSVRDPKVGLHLRRGQPSFIDSFAIMVGASQSAVVNGAHDRSPTSNYGSRVDCYAWGENIVTSGGDGELTPQAGPDAAYTGDFGGTSGATAIVAGAAAAVQGMYRAATGNALPPDDMRTVLANAANGTPQGPGVPGAIGSMPDLRRIGTTVFNSQPLPAGP